MAFPHMRIMDIDRTHSVTCLVSLPLSLLIPSSSLTALFCFHGAPPPPTSRCNGGCLLLLRFQNLVYLDNCQLCVLSLLPEIWAQHSFWMLRTNLRDELTGKLR